MDLNNGTTAQLTLGSRAPQMRPLSGRNQTTSVRFGRTDENILVARSSEDRAANVAGQALALGSTFVDPIVEDTTLKTALPTCLLIGGELASQTSAVLWRRGGESTIACEPPMRGASAGPKGKAKGKEITKFLCLRMGKARYDGLDHPSSKSCLKRLIRILPYNLIEAVFKRPDARRLTASKIFDLYAQLYHVMYPGNWVILKVVNGEVVAEEVHKRVMHGAEPEKSAKLLISVFVVRKQLNGANGEVTNKDDVKFQYTEAERSEATHIVKEHFRLYKTTPSKKVLDDAVLAFMDGRRIKRGEKLRDWTNLERETFMAVATEKYPQLEGNDLVAAAHDWFKKDLLEQFNLFVMADPNNYYAPLQDADDLDLSAFIDPPVVHPFSGAVPPPNAWQELPHPKEEPPEKYKPAKTFYNPREPRANPVEEEETKDQEANRAHRFELVLSSVEEKAHYASRSKHGLCDAGKVRKKPLKEKRRKMSPILQSDEFTLAFQNNQTLLNGMVVHKVHKSYFPHVPKLGEEEDVQPSNPIPFPEFIMGEEVIDDTREESFSLVTSKYALNGEGLFRLVEGRWVEILSAGGRARTFRGLKIKPIQAQKLGGNYASVERSGEDLLNLFKPGEQDCVILNPIEEIHDFTSAAIGYKWFAKFRLALETYFNPGELYNGYTEEKRTIFVHRPLLDKLKRKLASATNELIYNTIFGLANESCSCPALALDTVLYFFEMKTLLQASSVATVDAHAVYSKQRWLHRPPISGVSSDPFSETYTTCDEGPVVIATRESVRSDHSKGVTSIHREMYTSCSPVYGSYDDPVRKSGGMLEPLNSAEEVAMASRGVLFKDPYIKFEYSEADVKDAWQSVGGGFATSVAVINHLSTRQSEMAHSRILFAREDETEQRYKASRYWDEVKNIFESLCRNEDAGWSSKSNKAMKALVREIKNRDPLYQGGERIYETWGNLGFHYEDLPVQTSLQAFTQACLHHTMSSIQISHEDERRYDTVQALDDYIEEVGAKLPLRRALVSKIRERMLKGVQSRVNLVQCKPHEFQKYKIIDGKPCLKYARDVVSITGEDWVAARPELLAYIKKSLEGKHTVTFIQEGEQVVISVEYDSTDSVGNSQSLHKYYLLPATLKKRLVEESGYIPLGNAFHYRSIIQGTDLTTLGTYMDEMYETVSSKPGDLFVITHGDDQLAAIYNTNPNRYDGRMGLVYIEGDINDNDGSHVDQFYRLDFLTFVKRGEAPVTPFAQLANPLFLCNPNDVTQYATLRRTHGMQMCSGSVHTTYGNSKMSMNVGMSLFFNPDLKYEDAARTVGMNVTTLIGGLTDVTFLSKNFYHPNGSRRICCYTDFASLLRKIGRATGDVIGKSNIPIDIRFDDHNEGIVRGWVHEPSSKVVEMMRRKYVHSRPRYKKIFGSYIKVPNLRFSTETTEVVTVTALGCNLTTTIETITGTIPQILSRELSEVDAAAIRHYYPENLELGYTEYQNMLQILSEADTFGVLIKSNFIDRVMNRRYGMIPVVR